MFHAHLFFLPWLLWCAKILFLPKDLEEVPIQFLRHNPETQVPKPKPNALWIDWKRNTSWFAFCRPITPWKCARFPEAVCVASDHAPRGVGGELCVYKYHTPSFILLMFSGVVEISNDRKSTFTSVKPYFQDCKCSQSSGFWNCTGLNFRLKLERKNRLVHFKVGHTQRLYFLLLSEICQWGAL